MSTDTNVSQLIINRLSNEQYETAVKNDTELYLTPEEPASTTNLGPVKVDGTSITATADGTISATQQLTVDTALSDTSTNPVQNKVVKEALDTKQNTITGAASTVVSDNLVVSRAVISNASGKIGVSDITSTELEYVHGVTSNIQTQLNNKINLSARGTANGVASLDANTKIPAAQIPDTYVKNGDILYDYNSFAANLPHQIYQAKLDNTLYEADKRFTVTLTNFKSGAANPAYLFDANGETAPRIEKGVSNAQILIEGPNNLGMVYPYGYIYLSFYGTHAPASLDKISCRVYQNWSGHNIGWVNLTAQEVYKTTAVIVVRFATQNYGINKIEFTIDNTDGGVHSEDNYSIWPCDIAFFCNRTGIHSLPVMTKWGADTKYGSLTIPTANGSFIGNVIGTADKATNDVDGNPIKTTYLKVADTPVVNNATLTIQADGTSKGTFTANASLNTTINIQKSDFYPTKTYTGLIGTTNAWKNACFYLMTLRPNTWDGEWAVKYKVESSLDAGLTPSNYKMFTSQHECYLTGRQGVYTAYAIFNSFSSTSYRPLYYFTNHRTTEDGYNAGYGHKLGINLTSSNSNLDVNYKRTFKITILDTSNCTCTFNEEPEIAPNSDRTDYTKLNSTYYTTSDSNSAGNFTNLNGCDNGLQESGNANTTDVTNLNNYYLVNGSKNDTTSLRIFGYNLIGFGRDGKALCISVPTAATTANTTAIQTARVYNTEGFEPSKGLLYTNSSTVFGADANINITPRKFTGSVDMRYSDNCIAASTANDLGFVLRKPIYLRGTIGTDGLFYVAPMEVTYNSATYKRAWIQDLPTTEDGYVYWFVGYPYYNSSYPNSLYQFDLNAANHVIHYKNGKYQTYVPASNTTGTFTSSNWILSSGKYTYTIPVTTTTETVHVDVFDGNGIQVQPEDMTIIKTNGNVTSVKLTIASVPDCRFAGSYTLSF